MAYKVVTSAEFDADLDEAVAYRVDARGLRSARHLLEEVDRISNLLSTTPRMGSPIEQSTDDPSPSALRWVRIDTYIAAYRVYDVQETVVLAKLFYASSNWRRRIR